MKLGLSGLPGSRAWLGTRNCARITAPLAADFVKRSSLEGEQGRSFLFLRSCVLALAATCDSVGLGCACRWSVHIPRPSPTQRLSQGG
jgi:hypothetical protein